MKVNGSRLLRAAPIANMETEKIKFEGTSYGLAEAGYDIRLKQDVRWVKEIKRAPWIIRLLRLHYLVRHSLYVDGEFQGFTRFTLASGVEYFQMPKDLVAQIADKSTHARRALSVFNTVAEPNWRGNLTLELVYHGEDELHLKAGIGIAQSLFSQLFEDGDYGEDGKYQDQPDRPVEARD